MLRLFLSLALLSVSSGCAATSSLGFRGAHVSSETDAHCVRAPMGVFGPYRMPLAEPVTLPEDMEVLDELPPEARRTARAAGLEPLLVKLLRARALPNNDTAELEVLSLRQELVLRLEAFDTQVSALTFELDCTNRHVRELIDDMDNRESNRQLILAAASLAVGAVSSIVLGIADVQGSASTVPPALGLGGAVVSAGLSTAMLVPPARSVMLRHDHNLLRPMFMGSDPEHLYPSFVFRMLTAEYANDSEVPRDDLMSDFESSIHNHVDTSELPTARDILFGEGGHYARGLLETRKELLERLQSAVQAVARDLELFDRLAVGLLTTSAQRAPALETWLRRGTNERYGMNKLVRLDYGGSSATR